MVLEPMSPLTKSKIEEKEETKLQLPASEAGLLKNQPSVEVDIIGASGEGDAEGADKVQGDSTAAVAGTKQGQGEGGRRRKRKAPNPLSVRKAKNPRLTMEQKLKREQEFKKQKQRAAARATMKAGKIGSTPTSKDSAADGADGEGAKKRRRRARSKKSATPDTASVAAEKKDQPKSNGEVKAEQTHGGAPRKRTSQRKSSANRAHSTTTAEAPAALSVENSS